MAPSSKKQLASLRQNFEKLKDRLIDTKPLFEEIQLFRQLIATAGSLQQLQSAADAVAKRKGGRLSCAAAAAPAGSSGTGAACAIVVSTPQAGTEAQPAADAGEKAAAKLKVQQERDEAVAALKKKETENASLKVYPREPIFFSKVLAYRHVHRNCPYTDNARHLLVHRHPLRALRLSLTFFASGAHVYDPYWLIMPHALGV
eukprot:6199317-Pleurochrysis_carterae.AAC.1